MAQCAGWFSVQVFLVGPGSAPRLSAGALSRSVSGLRGTQICAHQRAMDVAAADDFCRSRPQCREHSLVPCVADCLRRRRLPRTRMHIARAPGLQCRGSRAFAEVGDPMDGNGINARCGQAHPHADQPLFGCVARCGCRLGWVRSRLNAPTVVSASRGGAGVPAFRISPS